MPVHNHQYWMAKALQQARNGLYSTHPNPRVGCVIVKDNQLISQGYHAQAGQPHAEIHALNYLQGSAAGADVYVTLEPCSHTGKTPPCADALIKAAPQSVIVAMQDPNPLVSGQGIEKLKQQDITVIAGVMNAEAIELNKGFIKRVTQNLPYVRIKMASTLDGRTALANGLSQWITGSDSRMDVQRLRASSSAVLSTAETVLADNASLNVRLSAEDLNQSVAIRQPIRVIIDSQLKLTGKEKLFETSGEIWIFTTAKDQQSIDLLSSNTCRIFVSDADKNGYVDLIPMMQKLAELEINEVHTECGAQLAGALIQQKLVDEIVLYMAPSLLGSNARGLFDLGEISIMSDQIKLSLIDVRSIGNDIRIIAKPE